MKLGSILGALSPGLSATGLFGNAAQGVGQGMLSSVSPILAMLLKKKKDKKDKDKAPEDTALDAAGQAAVKRPAITMPPPPPIMNPSYGPMGSGMGGQPRPNGLLPTGMQMPPPPGLFGR